MKTALVTMLELQDAMNAKVNRNWRAERNQWYRAIWVECAEMLDHYGWKWWKAQSPDMEQVELELIDIWHFGISISLEAGKQGQYDEIAASMERSLGESVSIEKTPEAFREAMELFALETLRSKSFDVSGFAVLMAHADLSFDGLFKRYVAKNVLNFFRQDHGYKEGTYIKVWNGREDNEHLMEVLVSLEQHQITRDRLYSELSARYPKPA